MPVRKITPVEIPPACEHDMRCAACRPFFGDFASRLLVVLLGVIMVYMIVFLGTLIHNNIRKYAAIGHADIQERIISLAGVGKVTITPDVALVSMGVTSKGATVADAQKQNTLTMNTLNAKLVELGIIVADIQTSNYSVYPDEQWNPEELKSDIKGYMVNQMVSVKIRKLESASAIIALAGEVGANNVSGLQFTVDDTEKYKVEARAKALDQIKAKVRQIESALGVNLASIVSYYEYSPSDDATIYTDRGGMGAGSTPFIQPGTNEVVVRVDMGFSMQR